jgi:hypothetical protein
MQMAQRGRPSLAARRQELMAQGMTAQQAMMQMGKEGLIDPRLVQRMMRVPSAIDKAGL